MALTRKGFKGQVPNELTGEVRQRFQPDDQYGPNEGAQQLLAGMVGAETMNAPASKGLPAKGSQPAGPTPGSEQGPRRAGTAQPVPEGNSASTGAAGPLPAGAANSPGPAGTGAGSGKKIVVTYGPGGAATGVGGIKAK